MPAQIFTGIVTKVGFMDKTATIRCKLWRTDRRTWKYVQRPKKLLTHDPKNALRMNDEVRVEACPPISKCKHFRLLEIVRSPEGERERQRVLEKGDASNPTATSSTSVSEISAPKNQTQ